MSRQANDLVSARVNEGIGGNDKGGDLLLGNGLEGLRLRLGVLSHATARRLASIAAVKILMPVALPAGRL
jgi:hypothetical protein